EVVADRVAQRRVGANRGQERRRRFEIKGAAADGGADAGAELKLVQRERVGDVLEIARGIVLKIDDRVAAVGRHAGALPVVRRIPEYAAKAGINTNATIAPGSSSSAIDEGDAERLCKKLDAKRLKSSVSTLPS